MHPIVIKHFSEISAAEYHRIVQAREAVFFLEQHITEPDADEVDPQSVFLWTEEDAASSHSCGSSPQGSSAPRHPSGGCW